MIRYSNTSCCLLKGLLHKHFILLNVEVSYTLQRICFKEQNFSVKLFSYAKFGYRAVSSFNNTKLEKLPNVKLLKLEISTFGLFCLFCQYKGSISFKVIESTTDISSEMNSMEAELEQNESLCLESCCRLDLMKRQSVLCEKCSKLEINSLHNLKASMKYVLTQYVSG